MISPRIPGAVVVQPNSRETSVAQWTMPGTMRRSTSSEFSRMARLFGGLRRKLRTNCARLFVRRDAQRFDIFTKIRDPVRKLMQLFAEFLRWSVTRRLSILHLSGERVPANHANQTNNFMATSVSGKEFIGVICVIRGQLSKRKTKAEMKRAEIFVWARIGIHAVIEANRAHGELVAQARAYGVAHIVETNIL